MDGTTGVIRAGSHGKDGELQLLPHTIVDEAPPFPISGPTPISAAQATIHLRASNAHVRIGGGAPSPGVLTSGSSGQNGKVTLQNAGGHGMIVLDATDGDAWLGGGDAQHASFHYDASAGALRIGAGATPTSTRVIVGATDGAVRLENADGKSRVHLTAKDGSIVVNDDKEKTQVKLDGETGDLTLGHGDLTLEHGDIHVKGDGDITIGGSDCAEDFDFVGAMMIDPGTVVVIDEGGALRESTKPYDRKVAGVCSGAGPFKPGLVLGREHARPIVIRLRWSGRCIAKSTRARCRSKSAIC